MKALNITICCTLVAAGCIFTVNQAQATPSLFDGHYYEFVEVTDPYSGDNNTWATAKDSAASRYYNGWRGHLATVTSQAENDFLYSLISVNYTTFTGSWLGGKYPEGWLVGPESGQPFTYTNWGGTEPNNDGYAYMNIGAQCGTIATKQWADALNGIPDAISDPVIGYFVEYEVPEPTSILLVLTNLILISTSRRTGKQ